MRTVFTATPADASVFLRITMLLVLVGSMLLSRAQTNITLSGKVTDQSGKLPLAGATVHIKGTTHEVVTNDRGEFSFLTGQRLPVTYIVSYVGYLTREVTSTTGQGFSIALDQGNNQLNDVVVIGYGTQKRSDLTGSIASVPPQALKQPVSSFDKALQGAVAGVQVTQSNGAPGSTASIRIRGGNSITGKSEPLYVIDGFIVYNSNADVDAGVTSGAGLNALSTINPSDIESISVLKDASATAIYGARGANGVIIITTKKGKAGKNVVTYDGSYGVQEITRRIDVLTSARDWALLKNEARVNAGKTPYYTEAQLATLGEGTDWQGAAFHKAALQNHQLSIAGGDERTSYSISGNYFKQDGILRNTNFERYSTRINLDRNVSSRFKVSTNFTASKVKTQVASDNVVRSLLLMPPTVPLKDSSGKYTYQSEFETPLGNPVATLYQETNQSQTYRVLGNIFGEYRLLDGLKAKVSFGADVISNKQNRYIPSSIYQGANTNSTGTASVGHKITNTWLNENTLNYVKKLGALHSFNAVAGFTQQATRSERVVAASQGFVTDLLSYNDLGSASTYNQPTSGSFDEGLRSFLGRVNYSFADRYLFTVSGRADGSSHFGAKNKWGYFPSAAFAWNLGKESFLPLPYAVNNLKLRLSAGVTGNQEISPYQSLSTLNNNTYFFNNVTVVGFSANRIANEELSWEKTTQYDAGLDVDLFKSRISLTVDVYYKRTDDLLLNVNIPYTTGQSTALLNYGSVSNKGLELALTTENLRGALNWNTSLVFSLNRNKVESLGDGIDYIISGASIARVGEPLGTFYGFKTDGLFQTKDDISKLPVYLTKNKPGDQRYVDQDGDGRITETGDRTLIGNAQPKFIGGLTNNFSYKGLDITLFFQGSYGNQVFNQNRQQLELLSGQQNASVTALQRWTPTNPGNLVPRAFEDPAAANSDRFVEDGSYLRLKNLVVGYTLPQRWSQKVRSTQVRLYVTAQNLHTWTKYTGFDPEVSRNGQTTLTQGIDYALYPNAKTISGGLTLSF
ncbi:TonB-dependent receptor [Paraflavisolibacter sp. H34]|uniref:SusC/RagA family TonB-linked outer membrane protein n=1 Tax=Huijunlia imazamoxiresistens TaxID=3127457 RepID=UPI00301A2D50